jgi:hypothetical protein
MLGRNAGVAGQWRSIFRRVYPLIVWLELATRRAARDPDAM